MPDWRSVPTGNGLIDMINQAIALGKIGGTAQSAIAIPSDPFNWRASGLRSADRQLDFINDALRAGLINAIPSSVTYAGAGQPNDWRAAGSRTGDPFCDWFNQELALGRIGTTTPPGTPLFWFDGQSFDGTNNSSLTDGQTISAWVNKGSFGAGGNLAQATAGSRPIYRAVAASGKINNKSAADATAGGKDIFSSAFTLQAQPLTWAFVCQSTNNTGTPVLGAGGAANTNQTYHNTGALQIFANSNGVPGLNFQLNKWQMLIATYAGAASSARMDGVAGSTVDTGVSGIDAINLFNNAPASSPWFGWIAEVLIYGASPPSGATIESYFISKYGAGFPQ